ncbi:chromosome partition protein Smc isoform X2 [Anabrus simplex]|uniref:chromosome partition protein Smc isoform X2 n=1 Tax=Anabrus simplex TaxID=316456 RepID=UPI0035A275E7
MLLITWSWNGQAFARTLPDIFSNNLAFFNLVLEVLLVIGGVELNPGPVENQCERCGTKYRTILQAVELREKELMEREKSILKREREADAKEEVLKKFADKPQIFEEELVNLIESKKVEVETIVMGINEQIKGLETRLFSSKSAEDDKERIITDFETKMLKTKIDDFYIIINSLMELDMSLLVPNQREVEHLKAILELKRKLLEEQQKSASEIAVAMMDFEMVLQVNAQEMHCEVHTTSDKKLCEYCELPKSDKLQDSTPRMLETDDFTSFEVISWPVEAKEKQAMKQMTQDMEHHVLNVPPQSPSVTQIAGRVISNTYETLKYYSPLKLSQSK